MSEEMFQQAVQAAKAGQRARAKDLLARLLKADATKIDYWLWMSAVVETEKEKVFALQKAIALDPNNIAAKRGLVTLGQMRPEQAGLTIAPPSLDEAPVELPASTASNLNVFDRTLMALPGGVFNRPRNRLFAAFALAGLAIAITMMCAAAALPTVLNRLRPTAVAVVASNTPAPTATVTATPTPEPTRAPSSCFIPDQPNPATPLAVYLCLTQTPTPMPFDAVTNENREAFRSIQTEYFKSNWPKVIEKAPGALTELPDNARLHFYIAEAYRQTGDTKNALTYYRSSIKRDTTFAPAFWGKAIVDIAQGLNSDAVNDWASALKADPAFVPVYLSRAAYFIANHNLDKALADLETAKQFAPNNALVLANLADAEMDAGALDSAAEAAQQALALDPGLALAYYALGRVQYAQAQYTDANRNLSLAQLYLDLNAPDTLYPSLYQAAVLYNVALGKAGVGDDAAALPLLTQSITVYKSGYPLASVARGNLYLRQGEYQSAREDFNTAVSQFLARDASNLALTDAYLGLGQAFLGLDRPDSAVSNFQAAVRGDPARFAAQLGLGQSLVLIGGSRNAENAIEALTLALTLTETEAETAQALFWRAQAHHQLKHTTEEANDWAALAALGDAPAGYVPTAAARLTEIGATAVTATVTRTATAKSSGKATVTATVARPSATLTAARATPSLTPSKAVSGPTPTPTPTRKAYP